MDDPESLSAKADLAHLQYVQSIVPKRMETINVLAETGIKGLTIMNGGAIVALIAMMGQAGSNPFAKQMLTGGGLIWSLVFFTGGLLSTYVALLVGYLVQQQILNVDYAHVMAAYRVLSPRYEEMPIPKNAEKLNGQLVLAACFGGAALACFFAGSVVAFFAALKAV